MLDIGNMCELDMLKHIQDLPKYEKIKILKKLEVKEKMRVFATEYHKNTQGKPLTFDNFSHITELYDTIALYDTVVMQSGVQLGKTEVLVVYALAAAACGLNIIFVLPHKKFKDNYVQEKILRPISVSPEYQAYTKKSVANSMDLMQFGKGMIKFVSANVESDMAASFSADIVIIEELDVFDEKAIKNIPLVMGRMDGSDYQFLRIVSNPKTGRIADWYQRSDKRVRKCPCNVCGQSYEPDWFKCVIKEITDSEDNVIDVQLRDTEWYPGRKKDVAIKCPDPNCSGDLDRLHQDPNWTATSFSDENIVGYHMPSILSSKVKVSSLWHEYKKALDDPSEMAAFYFRRLGLPYTTEGHKVSTGVLDRCVDPSRMFINEETEPGEFYFEHDFFDYWKFGDTIPPSVMGVDVSPTHLDISLASIDSLTQKLEYLAKIDPNDDYKLYELIDRYNVKIAAMDIGPERLFSDSFQENAQCTVWLIKYKGAGEDRAPVHNHDELIYTVDQTQALDRAYRRYKTKKIILPRNYQQIMDGVYAKEMQALSRKFTENAKGDAKIKWEGSKENHSRHADCYRNLAFDLYLENLDTELDESCLYIG